MVEVTKASLSVAGACCDQAESQYKTGFFSNLTFTILAGAGKKLDRP